jgi:hypothetical protein
MKNFTKTLNYALLALLLGAVSLNAQAQSGNALDFDGVNDYVQFPYNSSLSPMVFSVQTWVRINNTGNTQTIFMNGGIVGGVAVGYGLYEVSGYWTFVYGNGLSSSFTTLLGPAVTYGTWLNLTGTFDGATLRFYINGNLVASVGGSISISPNPSLPLRLGAGSTGPGGAADNFFSGQMDGLSLWKTTLIAGQIRANMPIELAGNEPNLLAYYDFNEGIPDGDNTTPPINTLTDKTSNHYDGTLNNFALIGSSSNWVGSSVLPITLINFSGVQKDGSNLLQWSTESEQNSAYFEVQRSENGSDFTDLARITAAGNSNVVRNYQYNDNELSSSPVYYYRLKMVDIDGSSKFSPIIFIRNSNSGLTTVYPNPARNQITINISDKNLINTQVLLSDLNGKVMQRISLTQISTQVDMSRYGSGMYLLKFQDGKTIKVVKE